MTYQAVAPGSTSVTCGKLVSKPDQKSNKRELTAREAEQAQTRANGHIPRAHEVERAQTSTTFCSIPPQAC
jgi:hypothetical protein